MFHRPHDYQAIFEAVFDAQAAETYRRDSAENPSEYYTLVPETFVLPEMAEHPRPFRAQLFRGHFEREGVAITGEFTVRITRVIHFRKLDPRAERPANAQAILFRQGGEAFLAHFITARPDFDQLVEVPADEARPLGVSDGDDVARIELPGQTNSAPLRQGARVAAVRVLAPLSAAPAPLTITRGIYLEHGDLEH